MYDIGLAETIRDVILGAGNAAKDRAAEFFDWWDEMIEAAVRKPVTPIWEEINAAPACHSR